MNEEEHKKSHEVRVEFIKFDYENKKVETNTSITYCQYYDQVAELQAKITDLLSVNAELVEAIELGIEDEGVDFLERLRERKKWKEAQL